MPRKLAIDHSSTKSLKWPHAYFRFSTSHCNWLVKFKLDQFAQKELHFLLPICMLQWFMRRVQLKVKYLVLYFSNKILNHLYHGSWNLLPFSDQNYSRHCLVQKGRQILRYIVQSIQNRVTWWNKVTSHCILLNFMVWSIYLTMK